MFINNGVENNWGNPSDSQDDISMKREKSAEGFIDSKFIDMNYKLPAMAISDGS